MIKEKIQSYFEKFPALKVLFFFDKDKEFLQEVQNMNIPELQVVFWENNPFQLKYQLTHELKDTKVFLYLPMETPATQEAYHAFPLMGLLLANKELRLDNVGAFMEEFGLQRHQKALVSKYIKELKYAGVQAVCKSVLTSGNFQEKELQQGLLSAFLNCKQVEKWSVLVVKLILLVQEKNASNLKRVFQKIKTNHLEELVIDKIKYHTGFQVTSCSKEECLQVARSLLYNYTMQNCNLIKTDPYAQFKIADTSQLTLLNQLWQEIEINKALDKPFNELLSVLEKDIQGAQLVKVYGTNAAYAYYTENLVWAILEQLQTTLSTNTKINLEHIENLGLQQEIEGAAKQSIRYLRQVLKTFVAIDQIDSYILNTPDAYIQFYTQEAYKIDTSYRRAISYLKETDIAEVPDNIELETIRKTLNKTYEKYNDTLNREWLKCLESIDFNYKQIAAPKQYDFYSTEVAPIDQKVVVIISDALRYEAGYELLSKMHGDTKNTAEIKHLLASIPSKTNVGMAQLLPGEKLFKKGAILSDQMSTSGTENRSKLLQTYTEKAQAVQFSVLQGSGQSENRELFKNDLVYVYHDVIDATGDSRNSERRTFNAVADAILELEKFVKLLHSSYNVTNVIITADHGFLYADKEIVDKNLERIPADALITHNRYFVTEEPFDKELGYTIPLKNTTAFSDDLYVTVPFSINRYRKGGVGHQFVHGGASLQELLTPLILSSRKRVEFAKKVNPSLLNKGKLKVVSNILKFNILQENEVSRLEKERTITVALYKDTKVASNTVEVTLNSTSESPGDRLTNIELILLSETAKEPILKLKVFDIEDTLNPLIEELVQNNTLLEADF